MFISEDFLLIFLGSNPDSFQNDIHAKNSLISKAEKEKSEHDFTDEKNTPRETTPLCQGRNSCEGLRLSTLILEMLES